MWTSHTSLNPDDQNTFKHSPCCFSAVPYRPEGHPLPPLQGAPASNSQPSHSLCHVQCIRRASLPELPWRWHSHPLQFTLNSTSSWAKNLWTDASLQCVHEGTGGSSLRASQKLRCGSALNHCCWGKVVQYLPACPQGDGHVARLPVLYEPEPPWFAVYSNAIGHRVWCKSQSIALPC